jgi:hypothetical protein
LLLIVLNQIRNHVDAQIFDPSVTKPAADAEVSASYIYDTPDLVFPYEGNNIFTIGGCTLTIGATARTEWTVCLQPPSLLSVNFGERRSYVEIAI